MLASAWPAAAEPPAPPFPEVQRLADELTDLFNACEIRSYGELFADTLQVYENDKQLVADKPGWLTLQQTRCRSQEAHLREVNTSFDSVLVLDDVIEPQPLRPGQVWECCNYGRAAIYKLRTADHKIVEVRFLVNEPGYWRSNRR